MKIIRYAGLEYKHDSKPTHLYHVAREGSHYLLYYKGGGSLSYDAKMTGTPAEVDAAFDQEVEFMGSGAYHSEKWNVATETPDAKAEQILDIFEHPSFGIDWEKAGGGQSSEDQFCDMLEKQIKGWKGSSHGMAVIDHPYWPKFHKMVSDAVEDTYGGSHRLYRGIHGEQAENILAGEPVKMRRFSAWTSDPAGARTYAAQKTKRGNQDWVVVQRNFTPEEIMFAPVELGGPCENPDILLILMRDVEHVGDEFIVQLESLTPGDFKIAAKPRGMKRESLLRDYVRMLLEVDEDMKESLTACDPVLRSEIARAKFRGVPRHDVNTVLARGGNDDQLALEISSLRGTVSELREYVRKILKEDPMGFVHDLAKSTQSGEFGENFFGGDPGKEGGRAIKQAFNKNADHQWLSSLVTVHWGNVNTLGDLVGQGKDELSTTMFPPGEDLHTPLAALSIGLWVKGRITLAANDQDDLYSGKFLDYFGSDDEEEAKKQKHRKASSGINKRPTVSKDYGRYDKLKPGNEFGEKMARNIPYVLDQSTWDESKNRSGANEALVDNWSPVGIIAADDQVVDAVRYISANQENPWEKTAGKVKKLFTLAKEFGVPIYDLNKEVLWEDK